MITIRCSSLPQLSKCSAPLGVASGAVKIDSSSDQATLGTVVHAMLAPLVEHGQIGDIEIIARTHGLPGELWDEAKMLAAIGRQFWTENATRYPSPQTEVAFEQPLAGGVTLSGHIDVLSVVDHADSIEVRIIDWKSGRSTDADFTQQMLGYMRLAAGFTFADKVTATVVNLREGTADTISRTIGELNDWEVEPLQAIVESAHKYQPGAHCEHCKVRHSCQGRQLVVRAAIEDITGQPESRAETALRDLATRSPAAMAAAGTIYQRVGLIEQACKAFRDSIREEVEARGPLDLGNGTEIKLIPTSRDVLDPIKSWPILAEVLSEEQLALAVKVSKTAALEAVAAGVEKGKAKAKDAVMDRLRAAGAVTTETFTQLRVVKKEAVNVN